MEMNYVYKTLPNRKKPMKYNNKIEMVIKK